MTRRLLAMAPFLCVAGCTSHRARTPAPAMVVVAGFNVSVTYSPAATLELKRRGETVVVFGYPYGFPAPGAPPSLSSGMGEVGVAYPGTEDINVEIHPGQLAIIPKLRLEKDKLRYVNSNGVQVLVNVVSGRRTAMNNLLDCNPYEGPLQLVQQQTIPIVCKLNGE